MRGELKAEGGRKSLRIALGLLIEVPDLHAVEFGEVAVEDDSLPAQNEDFRIDFVRNDDCCLGHVEELRFGQQIDQRQTTPVWNDEVEITNCDLKISERLTAE